MHLIATSTSILVIHNARIVHTLHKDPARAQAVLIDRGHSAGVAREVAHGCLTREAAERLGKTISLLQ